jgi:oligopeptide/dipeptide ABC transporter ATP-binding protein
MVFVSNSLGVIRFISERIAIMQMGRFVEMASKEKIFSSPKHPYTINLMATLPIPDPDYKLSPILKMEKITDRVSEGCPIQSGCPMVTQECYKKRPELVEIEKDHYVACHNIQ